MDGIHLEGRCTVKFCIMANDGRYVTQRGFSAGLTDCPDMACKWDDEAFVKALVPAYWDKLKGKGILMLAVFPLRHECNAGKVGQCAS